ncbi:hypothetical protein AMJ87_02480 [candidate division WOR_3 bacterium SM23_60]|uniref:Outer membrane protein beta-barrel domain-containing protein n=1 Tax=candidate division WOR_3 bacterium SM23_60 TaxID=1703780 RepID=A0A0S8GLH2_UNCW3|nr:MAG: hypothetical protein AMJ87_02480 [candidate division WOR_3 bacterium SM23_60]
MRNNIVFVLFILGAFADALPRFEFDIESGAALSGYNDIRIPNTGGTLISFSEELETDPAWFIRGRLTYYFNKRNSISILIAPLTLHATGSVDREVIFEDESFAPNVLLNGVFRFNSYRLSYQYRWFMRDNMHLGLGVTAKIRDAAISIVDSADSTHRSEKTNIGFVPLIRFSFEWRFVEPLALVLDGDALAAPQGRAEDISIALLSDISDRLSLKSGYRVLEGGADVDEVYSFTWVNYFFIGASLRF